jgi:hypothetical protein
MAKVMYLDGFHLITSQDKVNFDISSSTCFSLVDHSPVFPFRMNHPSARQCKIPDPSLMIDSARFTLSQAHPGVSW